MSIGFIVTMLWIYLYCFIILASIDFGAGIFTCYGLTAKDENTIFVLRRYLSPTWDGIQIVLLAFIGFITSFLPLVIEDYGYPLKIQAISIFVILILRTVMFTMKRHQLGSNVPLTYIYGITGLLVVVSLSTVLSLSEGGFLQIWQGHVTLSVSSLFSSFYFWSVIILAVISVFYISAMYFTFYSFKTKNNKALKIFRLHSLAWSVPTLLASALVFVALQRHNPAHFNRILDISWIFLLSLVSFLVAVTFVFIKRHYVWAFFFVLCQFFFAFYGYGWSHLPYILYPYIEIHPFGLHRTGHIVFLLSLILSIVVPTLVLRLRWLISRVDKTE